MKILMVSMFANHFFNWTNQLKDAGHEVFWIDVFDNGKNVEKINWVHQTVNWKRKFNYPGRQSLKQNFPRIYKGVQRFSERKLSEVLEEKIKAIQPDVIQSFVLFSACAPILSVMNKYHNIKWIYSAWGNDLFYFQNEPDYLADIKKVLPRLNFMFADCARDYEIAKKYGFNGTFLGVYPTGGGYKFDLENEIRPLSNRNIILIKGYQNLFGECIPVLKAIQKLKNELEDYEIIVFGAQQDTVQYVEKSDLVNYTNFTLLKSIGRGELMKIMGNSLIYIGNSISDGMPNTLLEAIIMGAFPIQSNPGGATEEIIINGKNGLLIENPGNVEEIMGLIQKAIRDKSSLKSGIEYNFKNIKPKLEREAVKNQVLKKYYYISNSLKN